MRCPSYQPIRFRESSNQAHRVPSVCSVTRDAGVVTRATAAGTFRAAIVTA
jgi:hypothetical protein